MSLLHLSINMQTSTLNQSISSTSRNTKEVGADFVELAMPKTFKPVLGERTSYAVIITSSTKRGS